jgi:glutaredoxin
VTVLTLYGRPGCGLCETARRELEALRSEGHGFTLRELNIDEDPELYDRYLERVPVVELGGEIVSELRLDPDALRAKLDTVLG